MGPDRTIVSGVAGARVRALSVAGSPVTLTGRRAFIAVFDGRSRPPVRVVYEDGRATTIR